MNEVSIENLLSEYDKCVMSKLINKEYKFEELKKIVKTFSEQTGFIKYSDEMKENEILKNIQEFINQTLYGQKVGEI